jgi:hypothetical protein
MASRWIRRSIPLPLRLTFAAGLILGAVLLIVAGSTNRVLQIVAYAVIGAACGGTAVAMRATRTKPPS